MSLRPTAFLAALVFAGACGDAAPTGTTVPTTPQAVLSPGPRLLTMLGDLGDADHFPQQCGPSAGSPGFPFVQARVDLELQNGDLIARSLTADDGNLVVTFHPDSGDTPSRRVVSATFSGAAVDAFLGVERMTFDSVARSEFPVASETSDPSVLGFVSGGVTFSNTSGVTVTCDQVFWTLVPFPTLDRAP